MSDNLAETPIIDAETWCPDCGSPPKNERAHLTYCSLHMPGSHGSEDMNTNFPIAYTWGAEAGGPDNVTMCNMIHRKETQP